MEDDKNLNQSPVQSLSPQQPPSDVPPVPETTKPKLKLSILFVGIIIFLILIGIASAAFIFTPKSILNQQKQTEAVITPQSTSLQTTIIPSPTSTPDPTASWKTFQNNTVNFSLKLPQEMTTVGVGIGPPEAKDASEIIVCAKCDNTVIPSNTPLIYIRTTELKYTTDKDTLFEDLVKQNYEANISNKNNTTSVIRGLEQINFSGEKAFTYTLDSSGYSGKNNGFTSYSGINKIIEVEHNGIFFVLIYPQNQIYDQILSTFKFTN